MHVSTALFNCRHANAMDNVRPLAHSANCPSSLEHAFIETSRNLRRIRSSAFRFSIGTLSVFLLDCTKSSSSPSVVATTSFFPISPFVRFWLDLGDFGEVALKNGSSVAWRRL